MALLPISTFTTERASKIWQMDLPSTHQILQQLAGRALLIDTEYEGQIFYLMLCIAGPLGSSKKIIIPK